MTRYPSLILGTAMIMLGISRGVATAQDSTHPSSHGDSAFRAMQERGRTAMGVDQYTSAHTFELRSDGGRIVLLREVEDSAGVEQIRRHLQAIVSAFGSGDFSTPMMVHHQPVPGTSVMAAKRARIRYAFHELPRGGEVRIQSSDPAAVVAIHEFLTFQRREHHAEQ